MNKHNPLDDLDLTDPEHQAIFKAFRCIDSKLSNIGAWITVFKWLIPLTFLMIAALLGLQLKVG